MSTLENPTMTPTTSFTLLAGTLATLLFTTSHIPMLLRAFKTKDLRSYSLTNFLVTNLGNLFYWIYVSTLPFGPIWIMHSFYTLSSLLMLWWYVRYRKKHS
jgi:uncharacterized protein with PQ loop repeat